ncbi:MAG: hypothetical protein J2O38_02990, partial [Acidimicrobiales bacterium]|nr:hypothetical protein [Acidimicrobiales bacterium]
LVLACRLAGAPQHEDGMVARLAQRHVLISLGPGTRPAEQMAAERLAAEQGAIEGGWVATEGWSPPGGDAVTVSLGEAGTVTFSQSAGLARARVVAEWLAVTGDDAGRAATQAMVAEPGEVARLNGLARAHLLRLGRLGEPLTAAPLPLARGERLVARWGSARSGLSAGQAVTVESLDATRRRLVVHSEEGHRLVPLSDVLRGQLAYGYALSPADAARVAPVRQLVLGTAEGLSIPPGGAPGRAARELHYHVVAGAGLFFSAGRAVERDLMLGAAAEVATPPGVVALIGQPSDEVAARAVWRRAAAVIEGYRSRWGHELSARGGNGARSRELEAGPGASSSDDLRRAADRAEALAAVRVTRHRLGLDQGREPSLSLAKEGLGWSR